MDTWPTWRSGCQRRERASITLSGEPQLQISGPYQPGYQTYRADPAVQKAIMDLLLAQPYETIPAT